MANVTRTDLNPSKPISVTLPKPTSSSVSTPSSNFSSNKGTTYIDPFKTIPNPASQLPPSIRTPVTPTPTYSGGHGSSGGSSVPSSPTQSTISLPSDSKQQIKSMPTSVDINKETTFGQKVGSLATAYSPFAGGGLRDTWTATTKTLTGDKPWEAPGTFLSPFNIFSSKKGDVPYNVPVAGRSTNIYTSSMEGLKVIQPTTTPNKEIARQVFFNQDLLKPTEQIAYETGINVQKDVAKTFQPRIDTLTTSYQGKVDSGELTLEQAKTSYSSDIAKLNTEFNIQSQTAYDTKISQISPKVLQFKSDVASSQSLRYNIPGIVEVGGLIGASIVAPVPTGLLISAGQYAQGTYNLAQGNYGMAALNVGLGSLSLGLTTKVIQNQVTQAQIEGILVANKNTLALRQVGDNYIVDYSKTFAKTGSGSLYIEGLSKSTLKEGSMNIFNVKGASSGMLKTFDFYSGRTLVLGTSETSTGVGAILPTSSKWTPSVTQLTSQTRWDYSLIGNDVIGKPLTGFTGTANLYPGATGTITKNIFGGATLTSEVTPQYMLSVSGRAKITGDVLTTGTGVKAISNREIAFPIEQIGIIKLVGSKDIGMGSYGGTTVTGSGQGGTFTSGFITNSLSTKSLLSGIGQQAQQSSIKSALSGLGKQATSSASSQLGITGVSAMSGLTGKSITKQSSNQLSKQSLNMGSLNMNQLIGKQSIITSTSQGSLSKLGLSSASLQGSQLAQKSMTSQIITQPLITRVPNYTPSFFGGGFNWFPIAGVFPGLGFGSTGGGKSIRKKQPKSYQPSLRALTFGIKSISIPKFSITGIGTRPILSSKRRKRKK